VIVIDASAVVDLLVGSQKASAIRSALAKEAVLHAPEMLDPEVLSTLRRHRARGECSPEVADQAVVELGELRIVRHRHGPFRSHIWRLRGRCSAYDGCYVALADSLGASLLTTDARLGRAAEGLVDVIALGPAA